MTSELNSELTITGNSINLTTGHFTINAANMTVDAQGNATFSGNVTGATITGGSINIGGGKFTVSSGGIVRAEDAMISAATFSASGIVYAHNGIQCDGTISSDNIESTNGSINDFMTGYIWCSGDIDCNGVITGQINNISDQRVKENITNLTPDECFAIVTALQPVSYKMKNSNIHSVGFIAQDVEKALDDLGLSDIPIVGYNAKRDMYSLPYANYVALLSGAIQYLNNKVAELEKK